MTTCTPIYLIPVVEGSDDPCDIGDTICDIAEVVEEQLDRLDALVARTAATIPMFKGAMTVTQTFTASSPDTSVPANLDTVYVDTNAMFDSGFPDTITFNTPGTWLMTSNIWSDTSGAGGVVITQIAPIVLSVQPVTGWGSTTATSHQAATVSGLDIYSNASVVFPVYNAGTTCFVQMSVFPNGTETLNVFYVDIALAWLGDLS